MHFSILSGLSTARANREVISIYLRCTAGRIVWNYPRGAIRVLLRRPSHLHDNFRACLKIYPTPAPAPDAAVVRRGRPPVTVSPQHRARIYLEAPRRLIALFGGGAEADDRLMASHSSGGGQQQQPLDGGHPYEGEVLVKCFRSVNGQVALYVEAEGEFDDEVEGDGTPCECFLNAIIIMSHDLRYIVRLFMIWMWPTIIRCYINI